MPADRRVSPGSRRRPAPDDPDADTPALIEAIKAVERRIGMKVRLVVVDTLSRAMAGGNENAPDDMGALVRNMDAIRQATGTCVLFIHHTGKDVTKGARGHSSLRAAIDTEIEVAAAEAAGTAAATVVKQRDLQKGAVFGFRLDLVVLGQNGHGEDVTTCVVAPLQAVAQLGKEARRRRELKAEEEGCLRDIVALFASPGGARDGVVPKPGMPPVRAATRDRVREWLQHRRWLGVAPGVALTPTERSKLHRALNLLKDKGLLGLEGDWVWLLN